MYNKNWPLHQNTPNSDVDWSALADTWLQQREQQAHWQQPLPPAPPPPPPQLLLNAPPIPPPGPPPIGMPFAPLPLPAQMGMVSHHHQLQVGSNTTQESFTMTNIENQHWRSPMPPLILPPPPPPSFVTSNAPQWRPTTNHNQPMFHIQTEIAPSFSSGKFWPPGNTGQQVPPPPLPPPIPPPVPPNLSPMPPQFPMPSFQHRPVEKRNINTSLNTSIPSLMDLPTSYASKSVPPPAPVPPVSILPNESTLRTIPDKPSDGNASAKRRKIPPWLRDALGRMEKEKEKKIQNTSNLSSSSNNNNNNSVSTNDISSKFDDDEDEDSNEQTARLPQEASTVFDQDNDEDQYEDNEDEDSNSELVSSTPITTRRSRFDDDKSTDQQLDVSVIPRRTHLPSPPPASSTATATLIEDDPLDGEEQFMIKLRRVLTDLLLEVTNEEIALLAKEVYINCKAESSTPVIRKASGLTSLIQSFSESDSDDEEKHVQSIINSTVISKTPNLTPTKQNPAPSKTPIKPSENTKETKSTKSKTKKSTRERSRSTSREGKDKKNHHKKHRRHSSSSSSSSSPSSSHRKKKSSNHHHSDQRKHDDRRLYRCLIAIILCFLNFTQWFHRYIVQNISRNCYIVKVKIDVIRNDPSNTNVSQMEKIQFNKPTDVLALIINERIPDVDLWKFIVNSIVFFRRLNIQHLIIYDYEGYIKARETSIMDYIQAYDKKYQSSLPLPTLHFLSLTDCSQTLTKVAQTLCQQVKQGEIKSDSIQVDTVDQCYTKLSSIPEINLAVIVGSVKSSLGLHPWQTRLTEFIMIDSYKQLQTTNSFLNIVQRYNQIEQRQGR
ncbi:unnamed protein product [Adineta ricciae]|uniref:Uncharacterized protein n=1 Tax=Adineta ricciae TaxID=249248 RepID=A0A815KV32_ADIRI|nr:unnamed protein product [Adineta ricciae]